MLTVSCSKEIAEPNVNPDAIVSDGVQMIFHATTDGGTRTQLDGKHVLWSPGDAISVFYGSQNHEFAATNTEPAATVDFSGEISAAHAADGAGSKVFAAYPYDRSNACDGETVTVAIPFIQYPEPGSFDPSAFPSVAVTTTDCLQFYNVAGGIKIRFTRDNIRSVSIESNSGDPIAGQVKVGFDSDGLPYIKSRVGYAYEYIWVYPGGNDRFFSTDCDYYVAVTPTTLQDGLVFWFEFDDKDGYKDYPDPVTFERNVFKSAKGIDKNVKYDTNVAYYPGAVDLGLSVQWGEANLGGEEPWEYGWYYSWGETEPKDDYSYGSYLWSEGNSNKPTKYNTKSTYGTVDNKILLDPEDDPAVVKLEGQWRMPTEAEFRELVNNCEITWTTQGGVNGCEFKSKVEGYEDKSIFIPAAGLYEGPARGYVGSLAQYWTKSLYANSPTMAMVFQYYNGSALIGSQDRTLGLPVRPVKEPVTLKDFAKEFVKGLDKWEATTGTVESDGKHLIENGTAWQNAHYICVGKTGGSYDDHDGNQHDMRHQYQWTFNIDGHLYYACDAWEIAIKGLLEMVTAEGVGFLNTMSDKNDVPTLANGGRFDKIPVPTVPSGHWWGSYPWFESDGDVQGLTYNGNTVTEVDLAFMVKTCAYALARAYYTNGANPSPIGKIGNYVLYGPGYLELSGYEGLVCPMREMIVLMRIYKYLLDNNINENVYTALKNVKFDFDLYGPDAMAFDGFLSDWAKFPSAKVSSATCTSGSRFTALQNLKVYANPSYIYLYVDWDASRTTWDDSEWMPFQIFLNDDGKDTTGGWADWFTDAGMDVYCEGTLTNGVNFISYNPQAYIWEGAVNGEGWYWSVDPIGSDFTVGGGFNGRYEIRIDRSKYPRTIADNFSLGVAIDQMWDAIGVLPNAVGYETAPSLQVVTDK